MEYNIKKLSFLLIVLFLAILSIYNLFILVHTLSWKYDFDYSESVVVSTKISNLYKSFTTYPYVITYYTPLFYILIDVSSYLLHVSLPYFYERLYSLIATIASTVMIYFTAKKLVKNKSQLPIIASLLFISSYLVLQWGASFSPVMFELLFDLIAVYLLIDYKSRKNLVYAAIALAIGFMFRQSALFIFIGIAAYLIINKKFKDAAIFCLVFLAIVVPIVLALNAATSGRFIFSIFVLPTLAPFSILWLSEQLTTFAISTWVLILAIFIAYALFRNKKSIITMTLMASLANVLSSGKVGAISNYFIVFYAICCIAAVQGIDLSSVKSKYYSKLIILTRGLCMLIIPLVLFSYITPPYNYYSTPYSYPFKISNASEVGLLLVNVKGSILSQDLAVNIAANKSVEFESSTFWTMKYNGIWNDSQIISNIKEKKFAVITYPTSLGWYIKYPDIINATKEYYQLNRTSYGWYIYTPNVNLSSN